MSNSNRLTQLIESLASEIAAAKAGSDQGQFPILDLTGNLRDEAAKQPETEPVRALCAPAWERLVKIVEGGRGYSAEEIQWLNDLTAQIKALAAGTTAPVAPASNLNPTPTPNPAPAGWRMAEYSAPFPSATRIYPLVLA